MGKASSSMRCQWSTFSFTHAIASTMRLIAGNGRKWRELSISRPRNCVGGDQEDYAQVGLVGDLVGRVLDDVRRRDRVELDEEEQRVQSVVRTVDVGRVDRDRRSVRGNGEGVALVLVDLRSRGESTPTTKAAEASSMSRTMSVMECSGARLLRRVKMVLRNLGVACLIRSLPLRRLAQLLALDAHVEVQVDGIDRDNRVAAVVIRRHRPQQRIGLLSGGNVDYVKRGIQRDWTSLNTGSHWPGTPTRGTPSSASRGC